MRAAAISAVKQIYKLNFSKSGIDPATADGTDKGRSKEWESLGLWLFFTELFLTVSVIFNQETCPKKHLHDPSCILLCAFSEPPQIIHLHI